MFTGFELLKCNRTLTYFVFYWVMDRLWVITYNAQEGVKSRLDITNKEESLRKGGSKLNAEILKNTTDTRYMHVGETVGVENMLSCQSISRAVLEHDVHVGIAMGSRIGTQWYVDNHRAYFDIFRTYEPDHVLFSVTGVDPYLVKIQGNELVGSLLGK